MPVWEAREQLLAKHGNNNFTHTPLNVGLTIWALLYGRGDFEKSILLAVNGGYDTDCTAATVGATIGLALGSESIPDRWRQPIGEGVFIGAGIIGIRAAESLGELTDRTLALIGKLKPKTWADLDWSPAIPAVDLATLPGTFFLSPLDGSPSVPFANGELPDAVKQAGGAEWDWTVAHPGKLHYVIALARSGARLFIDGEVVVDCPQGEPYVPAPHRTIKQARAPFTPSARTHRVRLELGTADTNQDATALLAYENLHICPWTEQELPNQALLQASV